MKKIVIILCLLFLVTGCNVTSNITINKDLSVTEEVKMTGTPEFFAIYGKNSPTTVVNDMLNSLNRKETLISNGYAYKTIKENNYPVVVATKNYSTVKDFTDKTIFKDQYFTNFETIEKDNLITLKASGFIKYDQIPDQYEIEKFALNIKVPYVVTDNNADSYDESSNTYTWEIPLETLDKEINLTFDKNKTYVYNLYIYISVGILILLVIIILAIVMNLKKKSELNNRIEG